MWDTGTLTALCFWLQAATSATKQTIRINLVFIGLNI